MRRVGAQGGAVVGAVVVVDGEIVTKVNATELSSRPIDMKGMENKRIRRRPMRSMALKAPSVKTKFVQAIRSAVPVGERNLASAKMEALKYIRVFCRC